MNKHVPPPLKMKVERGRLVPATQYDSERLDSYRPGSTVSVRFTADRMRPLERKYRAILGKVIKECKTPWSNAEAAHQALKLACGYVNVGRTTGGEFMQWPRSLVDFDDKEMEDYFESFLSLIQRITGVDPETLRNEAAAVGDDDEQADPETGEITETQTTDAPSPSASDGDDASSPTAASSNEPEGTVPPPSGSSSSEPSLFGKFQFADGDLVHLKDFARKSLDEAAGDSDAPAKVQFVERMFLDYLDAVTSAEAKDALRAMGVPTHAVIDGKRTREQAAAYIAREILDCPASDLEGRK